MSQPYIGQILTFAGNFTPLNYVPCNGQLLPISQYSTLYNLIGTTYGGDGVNTFAAPDLRSRVPVHNGQGSGLSVYVLGQRNGAETVPLVTGNLPQHSHTVGIVAGAANLATPTSNATLASEVQSNTNSTAYTYLPYPGGNQVALASNSVSNTGGGTPHENRQPYLAITYCIAVYGLYPSQS